MMIELYVQGRHRMHRVTMILTGFLRHYQLERPHIKALETLTFEPIRLNITDDITLDLNGDIYA